MSRFAYDKITKQSTLIAGSQAPVVIAGVEDGTTASQAYTVGQYLVYGGFLYKVISAIAQGDTFVIGTNISVTTVGNEITDIREDLTASNATAGVTDVPFRFGCDDDGNFGYIITEGGADTVVPFKSGSDGKLFFCGKNTITSNGNMPATYYESEYLDYNTSTKLLTVKKPFTAMTSMWNTYVQGSTWSYTQLKVNGRAVTTSGGSGQYGMNTRSYEVGDTIQIYSYNQNNGYSTQHWAVIVTAP